MEKIKLANDTSYDILEITENIVKEVLTIVISGNNNTVEDIEAIFSVVDNIASIKLLTQDDEFMSSFKGYNVLDGITKSVYTYSQAVASRDSEIDADEIIIKEVPALTILLKKQDLKKQVDELQSQLATINEIVNHLLITTLKA